MHCKSYSHFLSKKFQHICISLNVNFNESLTNDVVSFEQLGPDKALVLAKSLTVLFLHISYVVGTHLKHLGNSNEVIRKLFTPLIWSCEFNLCRPTGDQEVAGSTPAEIGNILPWRLIMKYFLQSFSPFR